MADRTIARMYDSHETALAVVRDLEQAGIPDGSISIVASNRDDRYSSESSGTERIAQCR